MTTKRGFIKYHLCSGSLLIEELPKSILNYYKEKMCTINEINYDHAYIYINNHHTWYFDNSERKWKKFNE